MKSTLFRLLQVFTRITADPVFRERDYVGQLNRATCMSLIINAIVVWNTRYMMAALDHLRSTGFVITDTDLKHMTPLLWEHITFHGSYHFDLGEPSRRTGLRPLRIQPEQRQEERNETLE